MATARLRKAFRYPDDSEDDGQAREELDEEEQDRVIQRLQMQNDRRNSQYSIIFAILPLFSTTVFVPSLFSSGSTVRELFISFLSILSLLATAYAMKYLPLRHPDPKGKRPVRNPDFARIQELVLPANAAVCGLLTLMYLFSSAELSSIPSSAPLIPAAMLITIVIARRVMISVDLSHLENLRYDYKGA
ncbi:hypothetical protein BDV59DRAFT_199518 [Aspergillus ambiguus]|uniref:uncharacterized protein n=1 Tax=Aspergillus ambiguus TaxID=176160 RepID=UPI003CCCBA7E